MLAATNCSVGPSIQNSNLSVGTQGRSNPRTCTPTSKNSAIKFNKSLK